MIDTSPPPNGFSTGAFYTCPLRIYYLPTERRPSGMETRAYWVYDHRGFLASCEALTEVHEFLWAEASLKPDFARKHYWPRARDLAYPGTAEAWEAHMLEVEASIPASGSVRLSARPPKINISLEDLGL